MEINREELNDFKVAHMDPVGDIYEYKGKILRIIRKPYKRHVERLMKSGLVSRLVKEKLFVETYVSNDTYEGSIVLEHRKIFPRAWSPQWSFHMMKDAARLVLKINIICREYGYELKDCHPANVLFDGARPLYVDFGSIILSDSNGFMMREEFLKSYYYPLKLQSKGFENLRWLNVKEWVAIYYHMPLAMVECILLFRSKLPRKSADTEMKVLLTEIDRLDCHIDTQWGTYQDLYWGGVSGTGIVVGRFQYEIAWINETSDIETMIEVGANQGYFSYWAVRKTNLKKVIATDYDRKAVDIMYSRLKVDKSVGNKITPLVLDFVGTSTEELKSYRCDLVVANALTHHLLLTQCMSMKALTEHLAALTDKYVIVEYMPYGVMQSKRGLPEWYTLEKFLESLRVKFEILCVYEQTKKRIIVIGKKRIFE